MAPQTSTEAGNALLHGREMDARWMQLGNWKKENHSPQAVVARLGIRNFGLTRRV